MTQDPKRGEEAMITVELLGGPLDGARWVLPDEQACPRPVLRLYAQASVPAPARAEAGEPEAPGAVLSYRRPDMARPDGVWVYRLAESRPGPP